MSFARKYDKLTSATPRTRSLVERKIAAKRSEAREALSLSPTKKQERPMARPMARQERTARTERMERTLSPAERIAKKRLEERKASLMEAKRKAALAKARRLRRASEEQVSEVLEIEVPASAVQEPSAVVDFFEQAFDAIVEEVQEALAKEAEGEAQAEGVDVLASLKENIALACLSLRQAGIKITNPLKREERIQVLKSAMKKAKKCARVKRIVAKAQMKVKKLLLDLDRKVASVKRASTLRTVKNAVSRRLYNI